MEWQLVGSKYNSLLKAGTTAWEVLDKKEKNLFATADGRSLDLWCYKIDMIYGFWNSKEFVWNWNGRSPQCR